MAPYQPDFITHYFRKGTPPFRTLSSLPEDEAIKIMGELCDDTLFGTRFKDPVHYIHYRRQTEQWVREQFIAKGGQPLNAYPIPMVLGISNWMVKNSPDPDAHKEIRIPLSIFSEFDISFTYPDSMISFRFGNEKPVDHYLPELNGKVFTRSEILAIVRQKGDPEVDWLPQLPHTLAPYIEAQVWNSAPLMKYKF